MLVKTSDLSGIQLDFTVARCQAAEQGRSYVNTPNGKLFIKSPLNPADRLSAYNPSGVDVDIAGKILFNIRGFSIKDWLESSLRTRCEAHIHNYDGDFVAFGDTVQVAGLRVYVMWKLGDEVEIPDELF